MRKLKILHTEASTGWGGQEIRILREAATLRERGHQLILAATPGAQILDRAAANNFATFTVPFKRRLSNLWKLCHLLRRERPDVLITHSSLDAWLGGIAARLTRTPVIRMRHLSAPIRPGLNSKALYRWLADGVVTTCQEVAERIQCQALLSPHRCRSIPTGIDPSQVQLSANARQQFREEHHIPDDAIIAGTCCVLRSWKGVHELLDAAHILRNHDNLRWLIVGDGPCMDRYRDHATRLELNDRITFTGHLDNPFPAMAAMDIFLLLSTANEGVSQASLQAAYLSLPLVTTRIGGLHEVCRHGISGLNVDAHSPKQTAEAVKTLLSNAALREQYGEAAHTLATTEYLWQTCMDEVEEFYARRAR